MGIRDAMQKNPAVAAVVAVLILVIVIGYVARSSKGPRNPDTIGAYFYDLSTGRLFTAPPDSIAPITAPDGGEGQGVRAYVYSCGLCSESELMILYIGKLTEKAAAAVRQAEDFAGPEGDMIRRQGEYVAKPPAPGAEPQWVLEASPDGQTLVNAFAKACDGKPAKLCRP